MNEQPINALENLGFSTYEARAYIGLLQENPVNGYRLSKITGIPRSRVYETLERLTSKGYAVSYEADPVEYAPLGVNELQDKLQEQFDHKLATFETEIERLGAMNQSETLWNLRGQEAIMNRVRRMIAKAEKTVYLVAWAESLHLLKEELETAVNRGIHVIIISCGDTDKLPGNHYVHAFEDDLVQSEEGSINLVVDGKAVLVGATNPPDSCQAFWSHNPGLISVTEEYIRHEIYIHKIIEKFGESEAKALQEAFAAGLKELPYQK